MKKIKNQPLEADVTPEILQAMTASGCHLFRNNRGVAKYGPSQWVRYGVGPNGASDFIGYLSLVVTPEMVGHRVAIFVAPETKAQGATSSADHLARQAAWRDSIRSAGGIAGFVHSWEQGRALVMDFWARFKPKVVADRIKKV